MQSLWRPPNLHHHPNSSCPSPAPTGITAAAHTHKATIAFNPSSKPKGVSSSPRFANGGWRMVWCYSSSGVVGCVEVEKEVIGGDEYLVRNSGWGVRRMVEQWDEMRSVAFVQAEAFHVPLALFDDIFFKFFQAEVLSALLYRVRNSPPNRYACLVAEPVDGPNLKMSSGIVGVVDITVQRDADVLTYLDEEEYIYVSGIAVLKKCRRMKVGSSLLRACEAMSKMWGFRYLVLRAYEDDMAALQLYKKQGYEIVCGDPKWMAAWIGRRRRVLMIKSA